MFLNSPHLSLGSFSGRLFLRFHDAPRSMYRFHISNIIPGPYRVAVSGTPRHDDLLLADGASPGSRPRARGFQLSKPPAFPNETGKCHATMGETDATGRRLCRRCGGSIFVPKHGGQCCQKLSTLPTPCMPLLPKPNRCGSVDSVNQRLAHESSAFAGSTAADGVALLLWRASRTKLGNLPEEPSCSSTCCRSSPGRSIFLARRHRPALRIHAQGLSGVMSRPP